jgi:hypothetical protein
VLRKSEGQTHLVEEEDDGRANKPTAVADRVEDCRQLGLLAGTGKEESDIISCPRRGRTSESLLHPVDGLVLVKLLIV